MEKKDSVSVCVTAYDTSSILNKKQLNEHITVHRFSPHMTSRKFIIRSLLLNNEILSEAILDHKIQNTNRYESDYFLWNFPTQSFHTWTFYDA